MTSSSEPKLPLLRRSVTLSEALDDQNDILRQLSYPEKRISFFVYLHLHTKQIEAIAAHHLGLPKGSCQTPLVKEWVHGSFNVVLPIYVNGKRRAVFRVPLPYKIGEETHQGNADEKLRCETATYAWINRHCPDIPIPRLRGYSFSDGPSFTFIEQAPLLSRIGWHLRQWTRWLFRLPTAESYVRHSHGQDFAPGYLVIDYVNKGQMLSQVWDAIDGDDDKRKTLYRDLSRVKLSLAATPFPRIGSLSMDNHAVVSLSNRPLLLEMHRAENDEIPTNIPRDRTYATSDAFVMDQLACMDNHVRHQPNAVVDEEDGEGQMAALTMMRGILPHYVDQTHRFGPFVLSFTDLHTSNVFVDTESGHITSLIDLEWAFAGPVDMVMMAPFWLTQKAIDELTDDNLVAYDQRRQEFVHAFRTEEAALRCGGKTVWTEQMQQGWDNQSFWYYMALQSPTGLYNLFLDHLCPPYGMLPEHWTVFDAAVSRYWTRGAAQFIHDKLQEREHYQENLRAFFQQETERLESDVDGDGKQATEGAPKELSL